MRESAILWQSGAWTVRRGDGQLTVYRDGFTCATADSSYRDDADGLSIAIARATYCAKRER
jgi:hypothetical protein